MIYSDFLAVFAYVGWQVGENWFCAFRKVPYPFSASTSFSLLLILPDLFGSVSIRVGLEWVSSGLRYWVSKPPHCLATQDLSGLFTCEVRLSVPPPGPEK